MADASSSTALDYRTHTPQYYTSAWPVECGGSRRQKLVPSPGLGLDKGNECLVSRSRDTRGWAVMMVQRAPGELYLLCGAPLDEGELPPATRETDDGTASGWIERIDPETLEAINRSPNLPSGGYLWCGAVAVHANGDLYVVNGCYCHRLSPDLKVLAECRLPYDGPYNGLLVLSDGNLVMKNLGCDASEQCVFSVLDPNTLHHTCKPLRIDESCMGRFSSDVAEDGTEHIYFSNTHQLRRLVYCGGHLHMDVNWNASYAVEGADQSPGWDTTIGSGSVWMMDMGRPWNWQGVANAPQRAYRFSIADPTDCDVINAIGRPRAFNPGPPLYDPERQILVHYDTVGSTVVAHHFLGPGNLRELWRKQYRNSVQMMLYPSTGELVLEDSPQTMRLDATLGGHAVIVDIITGDEKGRAPLHVRGTMGMFMCPGFSRDFYVCSIAGTIARVYVDNAPYATARL